uniref:Uncharacterized protein n=1 Tax=Anguilla anguilla TaxID=7936 RepID=A0A0E9WR35_ANGAN
MTCCVSHFNLLTKKKNIRKKYSFTFFFRWWHHTVQEKNENKRKISRLLLKSQPRSCGNLGNGSKALLILSNGELRSIT